MLVNDPSNGTQNHSPCDCSSTSFTYTPNANWNGTDTMTYKVSFQNSPPYQYSELATITVIVNPVNDAPIAYDFSKNVDEDSEITFALRETSPGSNTGTDNEGGVYDPDIETDQDDDITFSIVTQPSNGTAELISNNDIKYTPNTDFVGTDTFTYRGNDGELNSNTATITINVNPVNDAPVTTDGSATTNEDTAVTLTVVAHDNDGDNFSYSIVSNPSNGTVSLSSDTLIVASASEAGGNSSAQIKFSVPVGDGELLLQFSYGLNGWTRDNTSVDEWNQYGYDWQAYTNQILEILDDLSWVNTYAEFGSLFSGFNSLVTGSATYTPDSNWNGTDTFTFKANDGSLDSNTSTATITVNPIYDETDSDITTTDINFGLVFETSTGTYINSKNSIGLTEFDENLNVLNTWTPDFNESVYSVMESSGGDFYATMDCDTDNGMGEGIKLLKTDSNLNQIFKTDCYLHPDYNSGWSQNAIILDNDEVLAVLDVSGKVGPGSSDGMLIVHYNSDGTIKNVIDTNTNDTPNDYQTGGIVKHADGFTFVGYSHLKKFDYDGNVLIDWTSWGNSNAMNGYNTYRMLQATKDGGIILGSYSQQGVRTSSKVSSQRFDSNVVERSTDYGVLLVKFSSDLSLEFETLVNSNDFYEAARGGLHEDDDGFFYMAGVKRNAESGPYWMTFLKFDSSGNLLLYEEFGESDGDYVVPRGLVKDPVFDQFNLIGKRYITDPDSHWLIKIDKNGQRTARTF